ncbi:PEP-CTERM sorting domain-containing protein [Paucibacter sp. B2R-40]|uniref:PEP-CTERM sorting domain-containing protein n=1 Tax=Paucibacter sp. B2R-40 TaxID=2893554 RepID=UPI0021E3C7B6|nr:PEP-CTERM sorting domain-containing protein [Paucibacter sp. B2R-40]MCV2354352.1 PEP-CTERM sorting domain-containing protein [Paucibacter sp. B2R-40]
MSRTSTSLRKLAFSTLFLAAMSVGASAYAAKAAAPGSESLQSALQRPVSASMFESLGGPVALGSQFVNVAGILSQGGFGDPDTTVLTFNVGANVQITGLSWDVDLEAYDPSWLSEIRVTLSNNAVTTGVHFRPGVGNNAAGVGHFSGTSDYVALGLDFAVDGDGILRLEFNESFNDDLQPDGKWVAGHLTVLTNAVPEPSTYGLMALGLIAVGGVVRRRNSV